MSEFEADIINERVDVFLARVTEFSRARVQKLIESGDALVNGNAVKPKYLLKSGDKVSLDFSPPEEILAEPEDIPLNILYEDSDIIVVNKARGMVVHPGAGVYSGTLVNALLYHSKGLSGINGKIRPGIVHRLDKDTSGVMVVAKNDAAHLSLSKQIAEKEAKRIYLAIAEGNFKEDKGEIEGDIGRSLKDRKKMAVVEKNGKYALTKYRVIERFSGYTLIACELKTGRTHQIRVHMAHIGHPLVADPKYGARKSSHFKMEGQALHSTKLTLTHPRTGERMEFYAKLPDDMKNVLNVLRSKRIHNKDAKNSYYGDVL